ncbi:MAG: PAS domain-containing sensor histidine kinase [Candidatus Melainabacteria bacterium]
MTTVASQSKPAARRSRKPAEKAVDDAPTPTTPLTLQLDGLFGHLSCVSGLYAKETFLSLYSCVARMLRDHPMRGVVLSKTNGDPDFETVAAAVENLRDIPLHRFEADGRLQHADTPVAADALPHTMGFLLVLTDRLCAMLYWTSKTDATYKLYEGGWTFHPGDTKTAASHLCQQLGLSDLGALLEATAIDRRYDDKLNLIVSAMVNGLENRNRQLTVALDQVKQLNTQMVETERLAAIGQLSSVIAHEIRNPLGLIDLYAKLVESQVSVWQEKPDTFNAEAVQPHLSQIRQATSHLETILSELTQYARPLTLNTGEVDLIEFVRGIGQFYTPKFEENGVTLELPEPAEPLMMTLDADRIRQSLINLLKNALEASTAGSTVRVQIASRQDDDRVFIRVADQGTGIDPASRKKLFTPYFSTKGAQGTGLGLAHSRKILLAHGGNVELLTSKPGHGSVFALILPKTPLQPAS